VCALTPDLYVDRAVGDGGKRAGASPAAIHGALTAPKKITSQIDAKGRAATVYKGNDARVVVNPDTGKIISVNPINRNGVR
jgi:hypothetical protein